jgi:hypothetical protein
MMSKTTLWGVLLSVVFAMAAGGLHAADEPPKPPPIRGTRGEVEPGRTVEPLFATEDEGTEFRAGGRDPFQQKRDTEPLPLADLTKPPLPPVTRVAPGPVPGLGHSRLRPLEEPVPEGTVDLTGGPGTEGGEEEEGGEEDEWGRRRY